MKEVLGRSDELAVCGHVCIYAGGGEMVLTEGGESTHTLGTGTPKLGNITPRCGSIFKCGKIKADYGGGGWETGQRAIWLRAQTPGTSG